MPKFSANLSFLYADLPFLDRFAAAAKDGFRAVEYVGPYGFPAEDVAAALKSNGLTQALFNLPAGNWDGGERGIGCLADRVVEFQAGVETAIRYAQALGCDKINCLAGIAPAGTTADERDAVLVANLKYAAPRLASAGIKLLLEPINLRDIPGFHVSTTHHAERLLDAVGSDNLFIQYDVYHTQVMQGDLVPTYARLKDRIGHVQIADNPGRNEPGTGEINYGFVLSELDRLGYDGWVGCEYKPKAGTSAGLGWMKPYL
ncbi:MAG: hydroxypyruvate isomerase [Alphaproteobacteria bacterium]|uniref:hydroxypyruvate isomerase n=1 Tax=Devosia sp. XGJD_8 TaxID=3391187 RepID=UPI001D6D4EB8|nr:hydroxypyruvate isomerase [Alphaproteobacteria bacterium]MBU1559302.1 hydroxypyruvate isomerase [Alphaproteobacteria bacterium]MBU2304667.1 hydroxypyruvate isomerase [Alphaproteobacteria bacterium]MBU2369946.1 hydroxypyruvate isomerase [Alphaproteobacteria bacterium]